MPSDMWALGVTFHEMLSYSGKNPFTNIGEVLKGQPIPELPAYVPEKIAHLVYRLLDRDPAKRINCQDAIDCMDDFSLSYSFGRMNI
jgi:serine/threonine protein kinase